MTKNITKGKIGNALTSTANDHVVAVANDIYDESIDKYQSQINTEVEQSVFVEIHDPEEEVPQPEFINVEDATYAYNWKTTDTPASDGKTQGNIKDLYQKTLNQEEKFLELESEVIYDVSAHNDGAVFASLSALLSSSDLSTLIPTSVRHGGMTIRFIKGSEQSSDNKYVQYRLMSVSFSTKEIDWQNVDEQLDTLDSNISELEIKLNGVKEIYNGKFGDVNINVTVGKKITAKAEPAGNTLMLEFKDENGSNLNPRKYFYLNSANNYYNEAVVPEGAVKLGAGSYNDVNLIVNEVSATLDSLDKELKSVANNVSELNERMPKVEQDIDDIKNLEFITLYDGTFNDINLLVNVGETITAKATGALNTTLMLEFLDANSGVLSPRQYFYLRDDNNFTAEAIVPEGAVKLGRGSAYDAHLTITKKGAVSLKTLDVSLKTLDVATKSLDSRTKYLEDEIGKIPQSVNPLVGKKFFYAGDSIGVGQVEDGILVNWAKLIADNNKMVLTNVSRGGSTIRLKDENTGCIRKMIESISEDYDYIIFQGGVNDGAENVGAFDKPYNDFFDRPLYDESKVYHKGDIVRYGSYLYESKNDMTAPAGVFNKAVWNNHLIQKQYPKLASLDLTKTYSSMEYICKYLMINYPTKKFGFIVTYRGESYDSWNAISDNLVAICEKYGMPYIDLRKCAGFNIIDQELMNVYSKNEDLPKYNNTSSYSVDDQVIYNGVKYKALVDIPAPAGDFVPSKWTYIGAMDGWHCNGLGYKQSFNKIEAWMKTL